MKDVTEDFVKGEGIFEKRPFNALVSSQNEVTIFGADYDGAISAGDEGWQCGQCQYWNKKERVFCKKCDIDEGY